MSDQVQLSPAPSFLFIFSTCSSQSVPETHPLSNEGRGDDTEPTGGLSEGSIRLLPTPGHSVLYYSNPFDGEDRVDRVVGGRRESSQYVLHTYVNSRNKFN